MAFSLVIDPGHGGSNTGCSGFGLVEKDLTLKVGLVLRDLARGFGVDVAMTREDDSYVSLANRGKGRVADLALVIHFDTEEDPADGHMGAYVRPGEHLGRSNEAAYAVLSAAPFEVAPLYPYASHVTTQKDWTNRADNCLASYDMPATLIELAFLSNPDHTALIKHPAGIAGFAIALMAGVCAAWVARDEPKEISKC